LSDHVVLEVECIDRMYLNVYQPWLQHGGGVAVFFVGHRGNKFPSTALMDPMTKSFVADIHHFTEAHGLDLVHFGKERKDDLTQRYLAGFPAGEGVLYVGRGQEKAVVWSTQKRRRPDGTSYAWLVKTSAMVNHFYFYCVDADFGPFFLKFCSYFPFNAKLCINGHHWAQRQAAKAGIGFETLDNGFAACDDPAALQAICATLGPGHVDALLRKWLRILPHPFTEDDIAAGHTYEVSILQAEFSLTQMLDKPVSGRIFFDQVIADNLDIGRPDQVSLVFGRKIIRKGRHPTPGRFRTRIVTDGVTPSLHVSYKNNRIKQYHKLGRALRTETTINDTRKAHTFEPTCARWCLKFTGWRAGCLGPGQPRRAGRRRGPCRGPRRRAWDPGWRRDRQAGSPAGCGFRCRPDPAPGPGTGPTPRCAGSWCEW
jgi:hypothetical protein